jgi:ribonuclease G
MTRKRIRKPLNRMLCEPCFYCEGEGYLMSRQSICYNIYREVIRDSGDIPGKRLTLMVNPEIAERLHGEENHIILSLEQALGKSIIIYPNQRYHMEEYEIIEQAK